MAKMMMPKKSKKKKGKEPMDLSMLFGSKKPGKSMPMMGKKMSKKKMKKSK